MGDRRTLAWSLERHTLHPLYQRRPVSCDGISVVPLLASKRLHDLREERALPIVQHDAQLMPQTVHHPPHQHNSLPDRTDRKKNEISLPRANEHSPTELRRDGRLVLLDADRKLVRLFLPADLADGLDALELERVRVDALLQALDLVDREPVVPDEEVAHGDVQVALALEVVQGRRDQRCGYVNGLKGTGCRGTDWGEPSGLPMYPAATRQSRQTENDPQRSLSESCDKRAGGSENPHTRNSSKSAWR